MQGKNIINSGLTKKSEIKMPKNLLLQIKDGP